MIMANFIPLIIMHYFKPIKFPHLHLPQKKIQIPSPLKANYNIYKKNYIRLLNDKLILFPPL